MPPRLAPKAEQDLVEIYLESAHRFGLNQADRYAARLSACFDLLASQPTMARERTEIVPPVRAHFHGSHVIVYRIESDDIVIVRVLHEHRDWANELR